ncbi:MAG: glycoside hydrolase family 16 protein [Nonlabens sp.]
MKWLKNYSSLRTVILAGLAIVAFILQGCDNDEEQEVIQFENLVFADEFSGSGSPDASTWGYDIGTGVNGWGNFESQYYTDRAENVVVEDGVLKITAQREQFQGSPYTSARILTKNKFQKRYGRFEARIKLPWGQGIWPAFWMLGDDSDGAIWPQIGEIDIMEYRGQQPDIVLGSVHGPGYSGGEAVTKSYQLLNDRFDTDFHIFGIEWTPDYINYYVDDELYNQITPADVDGDWVFNDREFYIIMNVAVGGTFVGQVGPNTEFPQTMEVDYVRVYE